MVGENHSRKVLNKMYVMNPTHAGRGHHDPAKGHGADACFCCHFRITNAVTVFVDHWYPFIYFSVSSRFLFKFFHYFWLTLQQFCHFNITSIIYL